MTGAGQAMRPGLLEPAIGYALAVVRGVTPELLPHPTPCRGWDVQMLLRHASESLAAIREGFDGGRIGLDPSPEDMSGDPVQVFRDRASALRAAWAGVAGAPAEVTNGPAAVANSPAAVANSPAAVANGPAGAANSQGGVPDGPARAAGQPAEVADDLAGAADGPAQAARGAGGAAEVADDPGGVADEPAFVVVADQCITLAVLADAGALELTVHGWDLSRACGHREPIPGALAAGLLPISMLLVPRTGRYPLFGPPVAVPPDASPSDQLVAYLGRSPG